jgi:hypothetical protein
MTATLFYISLLACIISISGYSLKQNAVKYNPSIHLSMNMLNDVDDTGPVERRLTRLRSKLLPIAIGASLFLSAPNADAVIPSGSRIGGSTFRSTPSQSRKYSSKPESSAPGPSISITPIMPIPSPFFPMYGPWYNPYGFGFAPFGFGGLGVACSNVHIFMLLGGISCAVALVSIPRSHPVEENDA